jgi:hypothetical protein
LKLELPTAFKGREQDYSDKVLSSEYDSF